MLKRALMILLLAIGLLILAGCGAEGIPGGVGTPNVPKLKTPAFDLNAARDAEPESIKRNVREDYVLVKEQHNAAFGGSVYYEGSQIVCDIRENRLIKLDMFGDPIETFGKLGNGIDEFIRPISLALSGGNLYVLDSGNNRVQIYGSDFSLVNTISLKDIASENGVSFVDLSVSGSGSVVLTTNSTHLEDSRVYIVNPDGTVKTSAGQMCGYTSCDGETAYCVNTFQLYQDESGGGGALFSHSCLYAVGEDGTLTKQAELPYKYGPADFIVEGDDLYVLSSGWSTLDHFKTTGEYVDTIYRFPSKLGVEAYLARTQDGFFVADYQNGTSYMLTHEQD